MTEKNELKSWREILADCVPIPEDVRKQMDKAIAKCGDRFEGDDFFVPSAGGKLKDCLWLAYSQAKEIQEPVFVIWNGLKTVFIPYEDPKYALTYFLQKWTEGWTDKQMDDKPLFQ
ncbi:hypothetical protein A3D71_04695 [Candidatus Kaiserbacteria bacterium RIFCSPHIGHO2_02_FULL_55_20]|uniref:Uncharacterized protein n=1 Tax=Candidatus Kaiserbacteria bacterium RIFCSPHIGHO2_02_FULL_55_20 TaxID=1798497 RepID=A0A1F6DW83_9BACT|nr:MAG: hypothetical protein A2680_01495 [Candidatus Kaiserbacteria bacterium RIFCSPHIGHO2_01_FULL_55_37]OGG65684.1 MAG: hypothetical protein A3D71_04695 [Candidatus Kaiserbacteria bacterium RIFCSPHIGHO2_02_FULL_55_20]